MPQLIHMNAVLLKHNLYIQHVLIACIIQQIDHCLYLM